ncbi:TolC family protein [Chitinophaga sp.]|uniref:TolC family protein n=1 Tax=Chitinophaga sp. TaxID=1869181 RepID=UPI0031CF6938
MNKIVISVCLLIQPLYTSAQQRSVSIKEALAMVANSQPQVEAYEHRSQAASYGVKMARNSLMPELVAGYQAGYATYNNITGMSYPGFILPISGPPSSGNVYDPVAGSAVGAIVKWNPLTFGQRQAAVEKATMQFKLAGSSANEAIFRQQYLVILTYLDAVYLQKLLQSYQSNIDRTRVGLEQSLVFAKEGLRPGIDTIQFRSVLAQTQTDLLTAQQQYYRQLAELLRLTAMAGKPDEVLLTDTLLISQQPTGVAVMDTITAHPLFQYYQAKRDLSEAALKEVQRSWRPKLDIWANAYARGSGVAADGSVHSADGWSLTRRNYGAGIQLSFPILQFSQVNLQKQQYRSLLKADEAQLKQVTLDLQTQQETAQFNYNQSLEIAKQSLVQSAAARFAFDGLKLSYQSGLTDFTRLIQGQYDLLKAETAEADAAIRVWRSLLELAVANGNLELFITKLK